MALIPEVAWPLCGNLPRPSHSTLCALPVVVAISPVGGYVADRFSRRLTICGSLFVWSAVTWWTGHGSDYGELLWMRSFMGISEAFYMPAALALIADCHIGSTRSRAVGFHQIAIYCGVIVGGFAGLIKPRSELISHDLARQL
jgi:MFS family permease